MKVISRGKLLCLGVMVCLASSVCWANSTLLSENFDGLTPQETATSVGAFHTINGTNVDIVGGALFGFLCVSPESGNCVDLDGTGGNPQGVLQTVSPITLSPGQTYLLSFDLVGSQRGNTTSTTVTFGPYDQTFVLPSSDDTDGIVANAAVTVSTVTIANLTFTSNTPGDEGALLDNVTITTGATSSVPEPGTFALFLAGIIAVLGFGKLRHRLQ